MPKCFNDPSRSYKGTEPSPKGYGICAHLQKIGSIRLGKDRHLWIIKKLKNGTKRWVKVFNDSKIETLKVYLKPKVSIIEINEDNELYEGSFQRMPKKYKELVKKYLEYIEDKFFDVALKETISYEVQFETTMKRFNINNKYDIKDFDLTKKDYKLKNGKMVYEISLRNEQKKYLGYFVQQIEEQLDLGSDGWGGSDIVFLDTEKAKKLKLGNIPKNIVFDIFPIFDCIKIK